MNKTTVGVLLIALIAVGAGIWINQHRQQNPEQAAGNAPLILPPQEPVPPAAATADRTPKNPADAPAPRAAAPEPSAPQPSAAAGLDWNRRNPDALSNGN